MDSLFFAEGAALDSLSTGADAPSGIADRGGPSPDDENVPALLNVDPRFAVPALCDTPSGLQCYIAAVHAIPMLSADDEAELIRRWMGRRESEAGRRLVASHLRLVVAIAVAHAGRRRLDADNIQQGNIGLVRALEAFDPSMQARLSTYAVWWIRATISEHALRSWSLVRIGTNAKERRLFFNLRRLKRGLAVRETGELSPEATTAIAKCLDVADADVTRMDARLARPDLSLQAPVTDESETTFEDNLVDPDNSPEAEYAEAEEREHRRRCLKQAMHCLDRREQIVVEARHLREKPATLGELARLLGVSQERVRQIDINAVRKLCKAVRPGGSRTSHRHGSERMSSAPAPAA